MEQFDEEKKRLGLNSLTEGEYREFFGKKLSWCNEHWRVLVSSIPLIHSINNLRYTEQCKRRHGAGWARGLTSREQEQLDLIWHAATCFTMYL